MKPTPRRRRTVFDLTPQELKELNELNLVVSASVPPRRPRYSGSNYTDYREYAFDEGIYDRYRQMHDLAKMKRSEWLRAHRITLKIAAQAVMSNYNPYAFAARRGLPAPPVPEGYVEALKAWREPAPQQKNEPSNGSSSPKSFSF